MVRTIKFTPSELEVLQWVLEDDDVFELVKEKYEGGLIEADHVVHLAMAMAKMGFKLDNIFED
jgi:hypothetical protein